MSEMKTNPLTYESMVVGQRYRNSMINLAPPELPEKNLKITTIRVKQEMFLYSRLLQKGGEIELNSE